MEGFTLQTSDEYPSDENNNKFEGCVVSIRGCVYHVEEQFVDKFLGYCAKTNQTFPHPQPSRDAAINYSYIQLRKG